MFRGANHHRIDILQRIAESSKVYVLASFRKSFRNSIEGPFVDIADSGNVDTRILDHLFKVSAATPPHTDKGNVELVIGRTSTGQTICC